MAKKQQEKRSRNRKPSAAQEYTRGFEKRVIGLSSADLEDRLERTLADAAETKEDIAGFRKDLAVAQAKLTRLVREKDVLAGIIGGRLRRMAGEGE